MVALFALIVLVLPQGAVATPRVAPDAVLLLAPTDVPSDGSPFAVLVAATVPPGSVVEFKGWLGDVSAPASRTLGEGAWLPSTRYAAQATANDSGIARAWLTFAGIPGARMDRLLDEGHASLGVRARIEHGDPGPPSTVDVRVRTPMGMTLAPAGNATAIAVGEPTRPTLLIPTRGGAIDDMVVITGPGAGAWYLDPDGNVQGPAPTLPAPVLRVEAILPRSAGVGEPLEHAVIRNVHADQPSALHGVCLVNGRDTACFRNGTIPQGGAMTVARDPASLAAVGVAGAFGYPGKWSLPDGGEIRLTWLGRELDRWAFESPNRGDVLQRDGRTRAVGASDSGAVTDAGAIVTPLLAPDHLLDALRVVAERAARTLDVAFYTIHSEDAAAILADAALRGVAVTVLVEGSPVGGLDPAARARLDGLALAGVDVRLMDATGGLGRRYATMHAKAAVADDSLALVLTENANEGSFAPGGWGTTRGHAVLVESAPIAGALASILRDDANVSRPDVRAWSPSAAARLPLPTLAAPRPLPGSTAAPVTLLPVPDTGPRELEALVASATRDIRVTGLYLEPTYRDGPNPFVEALFTAALAGIEVKVLLAAGTDSAETVAYLTARADGLRVPLEAHLFEAPPLHRLHGKTVLVDGDRAWVGSVNWGYTSLHRNREVVLVVESAEAAAMWWGAFNEDWAGGARSDAADPGAGILPMPYPSTPLLIGTAVATVVGARLRSGRNPG